MMLLAWAYAAGLGSCCSAVELLLQVPAGRKEKVNAGRRAILGVFVPRAVCFICGPLVHEAQVRAAKAVLKCKAFFFNGLSHCVLPLLKKNAI